MTVHSSQGGAGSEQFGPGRVPDELIDAVLDGAVDVERSRKLFERLSKSPEAAREVASTQRAIDALKTPVRTPDMANRVLSELAHRHGFTTAAGRRQVWLSRMAVAAALVLTVGGAFAVQRFVPEAATLVQQATPVSDVVAAVPAPTSQIAGIRTQITCGLDELPSLSTFTQTCSGKGTVVACKEVQQEEHSFTVIVLQRTAPSSAHMPSLTNMAGQAPEAEQYLSMLPTKVEGTWTYAQSSHPGEFADSYAMWGPASGAPRTEPMMLVTPAAAFDWVGLGDDLARTRSLGRDGVTPYR